MYAPPLLSTGKRISMPSKAYAYELFNKNTKLQDELINGNFCWLKNNIMIDSVCSIHIFLRNAVYMNSVYCLDTGRHIVISGASFYIWPVGYSMWVFCRSIYDARHEILKFETWHSKTNNIASKISIFGAYLFSKSKFPHSEDGGWNIMRRKSSVTGSVKGRESN